jgi:capsular exopolysaccharide synthesis family protein
VLLDADWRRPNIHKVFNLANDRGLGDLLVDRASLSELIRFKKEINLAVLTAGQIPPNPTELLSSKIMEEILQKIGESADVVIIDGPPFIVTDALVLASMVDGVLMVVRPGHTRQSLASASMEKIKMTGARLIGVVLNRIPRKGADYYAGKSSLDTYLSDYGQIRDDPKKKPEVKKVKMKMKEQTTKT